MMESADSAKILCLIERLQGNNADLNKINAELEELIPEDEFATEFETVLTYQDAALGMLGQLIPREWHFHQNQCSTTTQSLPARPSQMLEDRALLALSENLEVTVSANGRIVPRSVYAGEPSIEMNSFDDLKCLIRYIEKLKLCQGCPAEKYPKITSSLVATKEGLCADLFWKVLDELDECDLMRLGCDQHKPTFTCQVLYFFIVTRMHFYARDVNRRLQTREKVAIATKKARLL
ncbi:hypothetical protein MTO96_025854 [Rhipicephalus appendiculatus]